MTFVCPRCDSDGIRFSDRECPQCHLPVTFGPLVRYYGARMWDWLRRGVRRATAIECPHCHAVTPLHVDECVECGQRLSVQAYGEAAWQPTRRRLDQVAAYRPGRLARRVAQVGYLALSSWLLYDYLMRIGTADVESLIKSAMLAFVVGTALITLLVWLMPRTLLTAFQRKATPMVKLAVVFNVLTLLLAVLLKMERWWTPAAFLAGLLVVVFFCAAFFTTLIWPTVSRVGEIFRKTRGGTFDPSKPQGRKGYYD